MHTPQPRPPAADLAAEAARLQCLQTLQVLDTPPDPTLDALASAAAAALGCPAALVSLVDETRQWFKARIGVAAQETPREWSFCHHAVQAGQMLVVPDARLDERFADNPLVTGEPHISFYAGMPLWVDGHAVGTLCVVDWTPRSLSAEQAQVLAQLTLAVQGVLERDRALKALALDEVRLRDFVYASAAFVWECDDQGRLLWASPGAARFIHPQALPEQARVPWNGALRDTLGRLMQPQKQLQDLLATPQPFINQWVDLPGREGPLTMALSALPVTGAQGRLAGWRGKARDICGEIQALHREQARDARLAGIAAHVPGLLVEFALTPQGHTRLRYASQGLLGTFGLMPQAVGDNLQALLDRVHADDIGPLRHSLAESARTLHVWREEFRVERPGAGAGADTRWLEVHATPHREPDGGVRWCGFMQDITPRRQHQAQLGDAQRHLRLAVQAARLGVVRVDEGGQLQLDPQAQHDHALRGDSPRLPMARWLAQIDSADHDKVRDALALARSRSTAVRTVYGLRALDRWVTLELQRHGEHGQLVGICRDTTDQHLAEQLRRDNEQALQRRQHEAEFISRASHELRTPMNAILGFVQLLSTDKRTPLALHQQDWLGHVESAGQHLLQLIHDLLDLSQLSQPRARPALQAVPLADAARRCTQLLRVLAEQAGVALVAPQGDLGLQALAQPQALQQLLVNVVGNAIKYNRRGGTVQISVQRQDGQAVLEVLDEGSGIGSEHIDRLFLPFERLGAEHGRVAGTGLGLAISRHAAESMGGTLAVAWTSAQGTCLRLTLQAADEAELSSADPSTEPAAPVPAAVPAAPAAPAPGEVHLSAVCVEDNPVNALLVECVFAQLDGWQLEVFASAEEARDRLAQGRMDLLLMDLQLPGEGGISALQHLHAKPGRRRPHCAAVTADASADTRHQALAGGFDSYLEKPLDLRELRALIDRVQRDHTLAAAAP